MTPGSIDRFVVVGTPDRCIELLQHLTALSLDRIALAGAVRGVSEAEALSSRGLLERDMLPALRT